ncbi:hypothetical protein Scep_003920 [Stephania cephalantha]|uniref:Reverse transcriptase domain-containing protein n=1 Tax=Stephania cephalantha TaxID=152367 RepID=A0AAP0PYI6_9MAGN
MFADETLLFCKANEHNLVEIMKILQVYAGISVQHINEEKSSVHFGRNVSTVLQRHLKEKIHFQRFKGLGRYLGVQLVEGQTRKQQFEGLVEKLMHRTLTWRERLLSPGGNEIVLKAIAQTMPNHQMSMFLLPKSILQAIVHTMVRFWWSSSKKDRGIHWCEWSKILKAKACGGLGFRDLEIFNYSFLAKQVWRLWKGESPLLLLQFLKSKYFVEGDLMTARLRNKPSWAWRNFLKGRQVLQQGLRWRVGNGQNTKIWDDFGWQGRKE